MSDEIRYQISVTPVEEVADENAATHEVLSGEVNTTLGGSGTSDVTDYSGAAAVQGYTGGIVNYLEAPDGAAGEVVITTEATASFVYIENTGYVFSSATVLGVASTRSVKVTANSGAIILSILKAGESFIMTGGDNAVIVASTIKVETVDANGTETAGGVHNAVRLLVVD
jgi:hypothetical protein